MNMAEPAFGPYEAIRLEPRENGVAVLTLNRPDARNALDMVMRRELADAIERLRISDAVRALVLTGEGGHFCAGGDLQSMGEHRTPAQSRRRVAELHSWHLKLASLEMPVIAAVDGSAFGGGFNLCLAADFILATPNAKFSQVFARVGLVPDLCGMHMLPRMIGLQRAKELVYSARTLGAEEAMQLGVVYGVVDVQTLMPHALELAQRLVRGSKTAFALAKTILNRSFEIDVRTLAELEALSQAIAMDTDEHHRAVAQFRARQAFDFEPIERPRHPVSTSTVLGTP